jgi:hypothetical protein
MNIGKKELQIKAIRNSIVSGKCKNIYAAQNKIKKLQHELITFYKGKAYEQFLAR